MRVVGVSVVWLALGPLALAAQAAEPWTLEQAVAHALANNPDARIATQRVAAARAALSGADAAFRPLAQLQSSYVRTDNPMQAFGAILNQREFSSTLDFNDVGDVDNLNLRGVVTVPIYAGGSLDAGREAATSDVGSATLHAAAVENLLAFEVARTFHTALKASEFIQAAEAGVHSFETNRTIAKHRVEVGTALRTDLLDMEVQLAQVREDLVRARNASALALSALKSLLAVEEKIVVSAESAAVPPPEDGTAPNRPELAAAEEAQRSAEARVRVARSGNRPRVNAVGVLGYDRGFVTDGDGASYAAGVMAEWDLWDGKRVGRVAGSEATLAAAKEEARKLRFAIELEVEQARLQLSEADERLGATEASVSLAEESVEITRARFEQGLMLSSQLIDAETALIAARVRRAEADGDRRIAVAALRKALGLPQVDPRP